MEQAEIALKLDPMNINFKTDYGLVLYCAGRYNDAINIFHEVLKADPGNGVALGNLTVLLHRLEDSVKNLKHGKHITAPLSKAMHMFLIRVMLTEV